MTSYAYVSSGDVVCSQIRGSATVSDGRLTGCILGINAHRRKRELDGHNQSLGPGIIALNASADLAHPLPDVIDPWNSGLLVDAVTTWDSKTHSLSTLDFASQRQAYPNRIIRDRCKQWEDTSLRPACCSWSVEPRSLPSRRIRCTILQHRT